MEFVNKLFIVEVEAWMVPAAADSDGMLCNLALLLVFLKKILNFKIIMILKIDFSIIIKNIYRYLSNKNLNHSKIQTIPFKHLKKKIKKYLYINFE